MKKESKELVFSEILKNENSAFLIDQHQFEENINFLKKSFLASYPKLEIGYSYKTNYIPNLCKAAHFHGCWAEVVSEMEVEMALQHLSIKSHIIYNGPIKSSESIKKVIDVGGIINIDNLLDIQNIESIIRNKQDEYDSLEIKIKVAIRLNFDYNSNNSRFGIPLNKIEDIINKIESNPKLELIGYHIHLPFRSIESFQFRVDCLIKILQIHGNRPLKYINIGGGFFGTISKSLASFLNIENVPDFISYGKIIGESLTLFFNEKGLIEFPTLFIEPGSALVADSMWFISRIHTVKDYQNQNMLISYAAKHLLTPTNKSVKFPIEFYQSSDINYQFDSKKYLVAGYTCIESDILGVIVENYHSHSVDFIAISNVGSYSIVMGSDFILPQPPIYNYYNGELKIIRPSRSTKSILAEFI